MIDSETESLWSHLLGEAMRGPLTGEKLEPIPSLMVDWKHWLEAHPQSTFVSLSRTAGSYRSSDQTMRTGLTLGIVVEGISREWPIPETGDAITVANVTIGSTKVLVAYDPLSTAAVAYDRTSDERVLDFRVAGRHLRDQQTGSDWDVCSGAAIDGELAGATLTRLPTILSEAAVWSLYHPEGTRGKWDKTVLTAAE